MLSAINCLGIYGCPGFPALKPRDKLIPLVLLRIERQGAQASKTTRRFKVIGFNFLDPLPISCS